MSKRRSLENQMKHAFDSASAVGESKRSYKTEHNGNTGSKIFGVTYNNDLYKLIPQLCSYLREECNVKWVKDIRLENVQGFLDSKAVTCNANTLNKIKSQICKLERICKTRYGRMDWGSDRLAVPARLDAPPVDIKTKVATVADYATLKAYMQGTARSEAWKSVVLSRYAGLRVNETAEVRIGRINPIGGKWGCGTMTLKGAEDGTKGGRWRVIDILTPEAREALLEACAGRSGGEYVIQQKNGDRLATDSVTRALGRACKATGVDLPKYNRHHSFRKLYAQENYDAARASGMDKKTALDYVNHQLGHGDNRRDLSDRYVQNQW